MKFAYCAPYYFGCVFRFDIYHGNSRRQWNAPRRTEGNNVDENIVLTLVPINQFSNKHCCISYSNFPRICSDVFSIDLITGLAPYKQ